MAGAAAIPKRASRSPCFARNSITQRLANAHDAALPARTKLLRELSAFV